jgi:cytochrome P450
MIAVLRRAGMPQANIRHNVKLAISGGQNEPRDAIAGLIHALLAHPDQYALVAGGKASFREAFEEYGRWISPIGMSPRRIARKADHAGVTFEAESRVFLMFGAANRDPAAFERAEKFEVTRDNSRSVTFGSGPHFCAGAHVARMLVAEIAVPEAFRRLRQIRLAGPVVYRGWAFRGPVAVPVRWDPSRGERLT